MRRKSASNSRSWLWWILILAAACVVYAVGISHESIWYDEAYSTIMTEYPPGEIIHFTVSDNHPPLYYLLLCMVRGVLGRSEWALRTLSVLGAVALVGLGAGPVRRIFGKRTAVIYAVVVLFTPCVLIYAHEARVYTLAMFAVTAGALYGYLAMQENHARDWVWFGLATLAAAYLHYFGLIAAFYTHVFVFFWLLRKDRARLKGELLTGAAVIAGYLPWLVVFIKQTLDVKQGFWLGPVSIDAVFGALYQPFVYKEFFPGILPTMTIVLVVSVMLVIVGIVLSRKKGTEEERTMSTLLLSVYLCSLITPIIVSLLLTPVFHPRYTLVFAGLLLLLISLGMSKLPGKVWPLAAVGVFALLNIVTIKDIYTQYFNYPMKKVAKDMGDEIQPGDLVITSDSYSMGGALYYFPEAVHYYSNNSIEAQWAHVLAPFDPWLHGDEEREALLAEHDSFWYITCNTGLSKNVATILGGAPGWQESLAPRTYAEPYSYVAFTVTEYTHTGRDDGQQRGTLSVHIIGLKPVGYLKAALYDRDPIASTAPPCRFETINVTGEEMTYSFDGLAYGEYVLVLAHDENKDPVQQVDGRGVPREGMWVMNHEKSGGSYAGEGLHFDELKFTFDEPERVIEATMLYPPFPEQKGE